MLNFYKEDTFSARVSPFLFAITVDRLNDNFVTATVWQRPTLKAQRFSYRC